MKVDTISIGEYNIPIRISDDVDTMIIWQKEPVNKIIFPLHKQTFVVEYWNTSTGEIRGSWEKWAE